MNWFETLERSLKDMRADFSALIDDKIKNVNVDTTDLMKKDEYASENEGYVKKQKLLRI